MPLPPWRRPDSSMWPCDLFWEVVVRLMQVALVGGVLFGVYVFFASQRDWPPFSPDPCEIVAMYTDYDVAPDHSGAVPVLAEYHRYDVQFLNGDITCAQMVKKAEGCGDYVSPERCAGPTTQP